MGSNGINGIEWGSVGTMGPSGINGNNGVQWGSMGLNGINGTNGDNRTQWGQRGLRDLNGDNNDDPPPTPPSPPPIPPWQTYGLGAVRKRQDAAALEDRDKPYVCDSECLVWGGGAPRVGGGT